jgi:hypothetical protein
MLSAQIDQVCIRPKAAVDLEVRYYSAAFALLAVAYRATIFK